MTSINELREKLIAQTPDDVLLERLDFYNYESVVIHKTGRSTPDQAGITRKVTRYDQGRIDGQIDALSYALATLRAGNGMFGGWIEKDIAQDSYVRMLAKYDTEVGS